MSVSENDSEGTVARSESYCGVPPETSASRCSAGDQVGRSSEQPRRADFACQEVVQCADKTVQCTLDTCARFDDLYREHELRMEQLRKIASYMRQNKTLRELCLRNSCGGDEGAAVLIEALVENDTLKIFALNDINSSSDTLVCFAKMLSINRTLEMVHLNERLQVVWPDELLSVLTALIRREACSPTLSLRVTSSIDEGVLREFFEAVAENKTLPFVDYTSIATYSTLSRKE
ncbi:hypothetical protein HPB52_017007 [Rhipicephalus sanguineus]|uniref:Uncharacterized protein n=1 Tax=Rhipicephalus sanguineus TaxID=34632 RepID=A0A9D4QDV1_RHISA|nr:hypothetical protein HPB52_017007 [Rhipicephalus sanguineus]